MSTASEGIPAKLLIMLVLWEEFNKKEDILVLICAQAAESSFCFFARGELIMMKCNSPMIRRPEVPFFRRIITNSLLVDRYRSCNDIISAKTA